ncbi:phospholipase A-2-activating protein [Amanita rubescens]|nr:phospholipase A-2-activating protein [Amanita rubescens]
MPYKLSATLKAHSSDVRALSTPTPNLILSASRDTTAIHWERAPSGNSFHVKSILRAGSRYVNSITYLQPTSDAPAGYAVTGGQDAVINIFSLSSPKEDPEFTLVGHSNNVCALATTEAGSIISGSWDMTAKVWVNFQLAYELKGHQQSVLAVAAVDEERFLTGSGDRTIKLWQRNKQLHTYSGHQDAVRGLSQVPDIGFASCSNDSEIRVWTLGGDLIYTLSGHTSFVYAVATLPDGNLVSSGEDRTVRVWKDGECSQTIVHPAISVWTVSTAPNGDIVSGCSDGIIRVFSETEERWASEAELKEYDEQVASQALPSQQMGDVKKSDLPGLEALGNPGKKSGEVKMIRNGDNVEAYQWDSIRQSWEKIGDVVDAIGQGRKQLYQGKEYDYVFDVDIQEGVPPLKLPYNVTENTFTAAQRFLQQNDLPLSYIDQVVNFIEKNTSGISLGANSEYADPFTGASSYRGSTTPSAPASSSYADPFTGASRHISSANTSARQESSQYVNPPGYSGSTTASSAVPDNKILPATTFINFKQANVVAMQKKLYQIDEVLRNEISTSALAMYPEEINAFDDIFAYLTFLTSPSAQKPAQPLASAHAEAIMSVLERWPVSQLFPVIDLARLLTGYCPEMLQNFALRERFYHTLLKTAEWFSPWHPPLTKIKETNILLALRAMVNALQEGVKSNEPWLGQILQTSHIWYSSMSKAQRVALASLLFNASCVNITSPFDQTTYNLFFACCINLFENEKSDSETVYRTLVGLGNIVYYARKKGRQLDNTWKGELLRLLPIVDRTFFEERVHNVVGEISRLL